MSIQLSASTTGRAKLSLVTTIFKPHGVFSSGNCSSYTSVLFTYVVSLKIHILISVYSLQPFRRSNTEIQGRRGWTVHPPLPRGQREGKSGSHRVSSPPRELWEPAAVKALPE